MKQCSLDDFMKELKPWLDKDHILCAELRGEKQLVIYFLDGMKNVYQIDDCNEKQIRQVLVDLKKQGLAIKE